MANLTENRDIKRREGVVFGYFVAAGSPVFAGAMVGLDPTGCAVPASSGTTPVLGIAEHQASGGENLRVRRGVFAFASVAGDEAVTRALCGSACYVADDQTVKKTAGTPAAPVAGIVRDVDESGVWVEI